ncbi:uncharacterized protein MYCGRDRAFT_99976 [Zymoseptoria tritici IPO323]|uniref:Uncharacterized protein n=1 Tax=Zymoseptoria tritici (strain CBS 115943 / IPO323) TaxID=336722 RepID=F9X9N0_ZYMTI|nr:uncharacterized protein MYCGRDRAFT_99976 [Zymoseptoria tritici IPO323]EGP88326.1 hypothetical protein MYCGRDRAFT_99976 [Zymoseptoria tritici IPO323]
MVLGVGPQNLKNERMTRTLATTNLEIAHTTSQICCAYSLFSNTNTSTTNTSNFISTATPKRKTQQSWPESTPPTTPLLSTTTSTSPIPATWTKTALSTSPSQSQNTSILLKNSTSSTKCEVKPAIRPIRNRRCLPCRRGTM